MKSRHEHCQDFAHVFLTSMLAMFRDHIGRKWVVGRDDVILRERVYDLAHRKAYEFNVDTDAAYAIAAYALATITVHGQPLAMQKRNASK